MQHNALFETFINNRYCLAFVFRENILMDVIESVCKSLNKTVRKRLHYTMEFEQHLK